MNDGSSKVLGKTPGLLVGVSKSDWVNELYTVVGGCLSHEGSLSHGFIYPTR